MAKWIIVAVVAVLLGVLLYHLRARIVLWYEKTAVFLKEVRSEMQKVVWPSRQDVYGATFVVMVGIIVLTIAIAIEDRLLSAILDGILALTAG